MKTIKNITLLLTLLILPCTLQATTPNTSVSTLNYTELTTPTETITQKKLMLENEFLKIIVNNQKEKGRFAIETTKGDPLNPKDDNESLIYGKPIPWTSYTTIFTDNQATVFGGKGTKIEKRSGKKISFSGITSQTISQNSLVTTAKVNDLNVTQKLHFFRNPSTQVKDTVLIEYTLQNPTNITQNAGLRLMLDTKLGSNDGAPFRIGDQAIISERKLTGNAILDFWQTFDQLSTPNIIAQGTLKYLEENIFPPDEISLVNWGTLVDHPWDFPYEKDRSFIREGEIEKDTALALYWKEKEIAPNTSTTYRTLYGLGGLTMAPGDLSLGITAPSEIINTSKKELLIIVYILNTGGFDSYNTQVTIDLPSGFKITKGSKINNLGLLKTGNTKQIPLQVKLQNPTIGPQDITITATSDTLSTNTVKRQINVIGPPSLQASLTLPKTINTTTSAYTDALLTIKNPTLLHIHNVQATLKSQTKNLTLPSFEIKTKNIRTLKPKEQKTIHWKLKVAPQSTPKSNQKISTTITSTLTKKKHLTTSTTLTLASSTLSLSKSKKTIKKGDYFYIELGIKNPTTPSTINTQLSYNSDQLKPIRLSTERWIKTTKQTDRIISGDEQLTIKGLKTPSKKETRILKVHFKALKTGTSTITLNPQDSQQQSLSIKIK